MCRECLKFSIHVWKMYSRKRMTSLKCIFEKNSNNLMPCQIWLIGLKGKRLGNQINSLSEQFAFGTKKYERWMPKNSKFPKNYSVFNNFGPAPNLVIFGDLTIFQNNVRPKNRKLQNCRIKWARSERDLPKILVQSIYSLQLAWISAITRSTSGDNDVISVEKWKKKKRFPKTNREIRYSRLAQVCENWGKTVKLHV